MNLKSSVFGLRGFLMTLVAALAIGATGPSAKAASPADVILNNWSSAASARYQSMNLSLQLLDQSVKAQLLGGVLQGKSYPQLVSIVDKGAKKAVKIVRSAAKDIHKLGKQATKDLISVGAPPSYFSPIQNADFIMAQHLLGIDAGARQHWMAYLHSLLV